MKLIGFELKKLLGARFLRVTLAVLLSICFALSFFAAENSQKGEISHRDLRAFYQYYFAHQAEMDDYYRELIRSVQDPMQEQGTAQNAQKYAPDGFTDLQMFAALYASIDQAQNYPAQMEEVVASARHNLAEFHAMGIGEESYNYRLQEHIANTYSALKNTVRIGIEPSFGWAVYFDTGTQNMLLIGMLLLIAVSVASCDRSTCVLPILHCTKRGKKGVAAAKIWVILICSCTLTLLFSFASFAAVGLGCGFSSVTNAIQSVKGFSYCPYALTIGQYLGLSLMLRVLAFCLFGALMLLLATLVKNRALAFGIGVLFCGLQYVLNGIAYVNADHPLKNLNLIALTDAAPLFIRLRTCNLFGVVCPYVPAAFVVCLVLTAITLALFSAAFVHIKDAGARRHAVMSLSDIPIKRKGKSIRWKFRPSNLYVAELYKMLIASGMIFVLLMMCAGKMGVARYRHQEPQSVSDLVYYDYMTELQGPLTEQKLSAIQTEREQIDSTLAAAEQMQRDFIVGTLTSSEYAQYLQRYECARSQDGHLAVIESRRDRLLLLSESGVDGWFLYDTGWSALLGTQNDVLLLLTVALFSCQAFSAEYRHSGASDGFASILRATPKGRAKTFLAKVPAVLTVSLCICAVFSLTDLLAVASQYPLPAAHAPAASIIGLASIPVSLSVGGCFVLLLLGRCILCLLYSLCLCALSCLLGRSLHTLSIGAAAIVLAQVLSARLGIYADLFMIALILLPTVALILTSYRKFCR